MTGRGGENTADIGRHSVSAGFTRVADASVGFMWYRMRHRVLRDFAEWCTERDVMPRAPDAAQRWRERIEILIDGRADYLGKPDPTRWKSGDVHELLMVHVVTRQFDRWDLAERAPAAVREFLRFLDETGRLHPASTRAATLLKELDRLAPRFPPAMADPSRWRLAKRVFTAMTAEGVPLDDAAQIDRWAQRFSALGPADRRRVLGELMDKNPGYGTGMMLIHDGQVAMLQPGRIASKHVVFPGAPCDCPHQQEYPPVVLPDEAELARTVAGQGSGVLRRLAELGAWAGDGRPVGKDGELPKEALRTAAAVLHLPAGEATRMRDLPSLARMLRLSLEFGVLELRRTRVIPGPGLGVLGQVLRGQAQPADALALWTGLYHELLDTYRSPANSGDTAALGAWLDEWASRFLTLLLRHGSGGWLPIDEVTTKMLNEHAGLLPRDADAVFRELASIAVLQPLADLAQHGAVELSPSLGELAERLPANVRDSISPLGIQPGLLSPPPGLRVRLTDLGRYAVCQDLAAGGTHVPLPGTEPSGPRTVPADLAPAAPRGAA